MIARMCKKSLLSVVIIFSSLCLIFGCTPYSSHVTRTNYAAKSSGNFINNRNLTNSNQTSFKNHVAASTQYRLDQNKSSSTAASNAKRNFSFHRYPRKPEPINLWIIISQDLKLPHYENNPEVKKQIQHYMQQRKYLIRMANNAEPYLFYIYQQVKKRQLPVEFALLPFIESQYDPYAYSGVGAAGIWQMMPGTASGFGIKQNWWYDGRRDVFASTNAALSYLSYLQNLFNGNWLLAVAAYDSGEGTVLDAIHRNAKYGKDTDFWSLKLPKETHTYLPRLLAIATILSHPEQYPLELPFVANKPYLTEIDVGNQISLATAAKLATMPFKELTSLNPGYNHWATDPDGPYRLILPISKIEIFQQNLSKQDNSHLVTWRKYQIKKGDTLDKVAKQFKTSTALLKKVNKLTSNLIHVKQILLIPYDTYKIATIPHDLQLIQQHHVGPERISHIIKEGDSLSHIAKLYHVKTSQIRFWNQLKTDNELQIGQEVILWLRHKKHKYAAGKHYQSYSVRHGDTLSHIATHFHTTVNRIQLTNNLDGPFIRPGQNLKIPIGPKTPAIVHYRIQPGDNLWQIAHNHHVSIAKLQRWNHLLSKTVLHANHELIIYQ